jgi:hypothetical protein
LTRSRPRRSSKCSWWRRFATLCCDVVTCFDLRRCLVCLICFTGAIHVVLIWLLASIDPCSFFHSELAVWTADQEHAAKTSLSRFWRTNSRT